MVKMLSDQVTIEQLHVPDWINVGDRMIALTANWRLPSPRALALVQVWAAGRRISTELAGAHMALPGCQGHWSHHESYPQRWRIAGGRRGESQPLPESQVHERAVHFRHQKVRRPLHSPAKHRQLVQSSSETDTGDRIKTLSPSRLFGRFGNSLRSRWLGPFGHCSPRLYQREYLCELPAEVMVAVNSSSWALRGLHSVNSPLPE